MLSHSKCPVNAKSCIFYRILVHSSSKSEIQHLSLKRNSPFILREHSNMKTLTSIPAEKIYYSSHTIVISLTKALSYFLASFHYSFINSSVDGSNSMILLLSPWDSGPIVSLFSPWSSDSTISASSKRLSIKISCWRN